jgi:sec-independent protein translocase protein TatB
MFGLDWTEIALIGVVALIAIGPKDLPIAIKTLAGFVKKARRMAGDFQGHVDEMVREANLHEVRDQISQLRSFDIKSEIAKAVDSDGSIRAAMNENPLAPGYTPTPISTPHEADIPGQDPLTVGGLPEVSVSQHPATTIAQEMPAPSFIPPSADIVAPVVHVPAPAPVPAPAFVPPETDPAHRA